MTPDRFVRLRTSAIVALAAGSMVVLGACGGDEGTLSVTTEKVTTTTGAPRTSTTPAPTTAAPTTTEATTTTEAPATTEAPTTTETPTTEAPATTEAPEGQGAPAVPAGEMTALVRRVTADTVVVDRVEVFTGEAALTAFKEDTGRELEGGEFYVRDTEATEEELPLASDAVFKVIKLSTCCDPASVDKATFETFLDGSNEDLFDPAPPFRLQASSGNIAEITQIYVA
ncbi:MAG: hypothetical protein R2704_13365 [Microthrixaceae bacterium]